MNKTIHVTIKEKIAVAAKEVLYICGNSDFIVDFTFDEEWNEFPTKTARFIYNGKHADVVFDGNTCPVPVISNAYEIKIGVFAGDLRTTTPARIAAKKSILCEGGVPADPAPDVYNQLMAKLSNLSDNMEEAVAEAVNEYLKENPIDGVQFETDESLTLENGILSVNATNVMEQDNTLPITSAGVFATVGNIDILLKTI
jgi:hypothetical protein